VAGTAASFTEAIRIARQRHVDVAVTDIQLGAMLAPRQVAELAERCRVVLFSAHSGDPLAGRLLAAGASAIVDKAASLDELDDVVRAVHAGRTARSSAKPVEHATRELLSERELEVYRALAGCKTPKEVAAALGLARSTVYCHIDSIRRKLGVETLSEIILRASGELGDERS
jgi:two-component system uhpT operon response regulator UhpA